MVWFHVNAIIALCSMQVFALGWADDSLFNGPWINYINRQNQAIADSIAKQTWTPCTTSGEESLRGSCLTNQECFLRGGKLHFSGHCGLLETCCTEQRNKCGGNSYTKVSYFSNSEQSTSGSRCEHNVKFISKSVCQIRLDFEKFTLANPDTNVTSSTFGRCLYDVFTVSPSLNRIPDLCGNNEDQHVYIHVNGEQLESLQLKFIFANRTLFNDLPSASWRIKITQLECPVKRNRFTSTSNIDYNLIAPNDCLQFYNESSGSFQSFNYKNRGPYPQNTDYSICIDRSPSACGIAYTPVTFSAIGENATDTDCKTDFLILQPSTGPKSNTKYQTSYYCGNIENSTITRFSPGPFYAVVHSEDGATAKGAFQINYRVIENC